MRYELANATGDDSAKDAASARLAELDSGAVARAKAELRRDAEQGG